MSTNIIWAGSEQSHLDASNLMEKVTAKRIELEAGGSSYFEDDEDEQQDPDSFLEMVGNLGVIRIKGPLVNSTLGRFGKWFGLTGYGDIQNALIECVNKGLTEVLMIYDTPGGAGAGMFALGDFIVSLKGTLNITAYTETQVSSAGVYLAVAAKSFIASKHASVGNVGVMAVVSEFSKMDKSMGITRKVYKSTPLKGTGNPYEPISEVSDEEITRIIAESHDLFVNHIAVRRGLSVDYVSKRIALGQDWLAPDALDRQLIDKIKTFNEVFLALSNKCSDNNNQVGTPGVPDHIEASSMSIKNKTLSAQGQAAVESGVPLADVLKMEGSTIEDPDTGAEGDQLEGDPVAADPAASDPVAAADPAEGAAAPEATGFSPSMELVNKLTSQAAELATVRAELQQAKAQLVAQEGHITGLSKAVAGAAVRAFVGAGAAAPDVEALALMPPTALLQQFELGSSMLSKRYGGGGRFSVQGDEEADADNTNKVNAAAQALDKTLLGLAKIHNK